MYETRGLWRQAQLSIPTGLKSVELHQLFSSCEGDSLWIQHCSEALLGAGDTHAVEPLRGELRLVSEMKFHF